MNTRQKPLPVLFVKGSKSKVINQGSVDTSKKMHFTMQFSAAGGGSDAEPLAEDLLPGQVLLLR